MKSMRRTPARTKHVQAPPLDLSTVPTVAPPERPAGRARLFGLPDAPTFYPTRDEWAEPIQYIQSIRPEGEQYGIIKIIPPEGWKPDFSIDTELFRFRTRIQKLSSMEGESRTVQNYLEQLEKFHRQQGNGFTRLPHLDRRPIDLLKLKKEVSARGGINKVTMEKKWAEIGRALGYNGRQCTSLSNSLKTAYTKLVLPYEVYLSKQRGAIQRGLSSLSSSNTSTPADVDREEAIQETPAIEINGKAEEEAPDKMDTGEQAKPSRIPEVSATPSSQSREGSVSPTRGEICEICRLGDNDEQMLLCDGCDRGYHMYCLTPPLSSIPNTDWYCVKCLTQAGDDYGFEDGGEYSLHDFQAKANKFKQQWFANKRRRSGEHAKMEVTEDEVEREFWRLVENPHETVSVEYGADLHSTQHGSGFPSIERHPINPYSTDPWNLNILPVLHDSLFSHIKTDISGMMVPWLYVGQCFSTFCWHNEDHYTYSINYMHWGETKTWYGIPASDAAKFEETMRKAVPELFEQQPDLLFQLVTMLSPGTLVANGVKVVAIDQRPGQFVVTFPQAYHAGFNHGFNFCEAVNFAPYDWVTFGLECVKRYQAFNKHPVFSHDELLITTYLHDSSIKTSLWLQHALADLRDRELKQRNHVRTKYPTLKEVLEEKDHPEEEYQCSHCNMFCYLSQIICGCTRKVACLYHVEELCQCDKSLRTLRLRYSDEQLVEFARHCAETASIPAQWVAKMKKTLSEGARLPLRVLRSLLSEADKIPVTIPEACWLRDFVDRANEWVEGASRLIVRKHYHRYSRRGEKGEGLTGVTGKAGSEGYPRTLETIKNLLREVDRLAFDAPEIKLLRDTERAIEEFQIQARNILEPPGQDIEKLREVFQAGLALEVDLEEMEMLEIRIQTQDWLERVGSKMAGGETMEYADVVQLIEEARSVGVSEQNELFLELVAKEAKGRVWKEAAEAALGRDELDMEELERIVKAGGDVLVVAELLAKAEHLVSHVRNWRMSASELLKRYSAPESPESRPRLEEILRLLKHIEPVPVHPPELPALQQLRNRAQNWLYRARKQFGKGGRHAALAPLLDELLADIDRITRTDEPSPQETSTETIKQEEGEEAMSAEAAQEKEKRTEVYCMCRMPESGVMVQCEACQEWYHIVCVKVSRKEAKTQERYVCPICDPTITIPRQGKRPALRDLEALVRESRDLGVIVSEVQQLAKVVEVLHEFVGKIEAMDNGNVVMMKGYLRRLEGLDVAIPEHTDRLRKMIYELAPPPPRLPKVVEVKEDMTRPYCLCRTTYDSSREMIGCDTCQEWYHMECVNITPALADTIDVYKCPVCCQKENVEYRYGNPPLLRYWLAQQAPMSITPASQPYQVPQQFRVVKQSEMGSSSPKPKTFVLTIKPPKPPKPSAPMDGSDERKTPKKRKKRHSQDGVLEHERNGSKIKSAKLQSSPLAGISAASSPSTAQILKAPSSSTPLTSSTLSTSIMAPTLTSPPLHKPVSPAPPPFDPPPTAPIGQPSHPSLGCVGPLEPEPNPVDEEMPAVSSAFDEQWSATLNPPSFSDFVPLSMFDAHNEGIFGLMNARSESSEPQGAPLSPALPNKPNSKGSAQIPNDSSGEKYGSSAQANAGLLANGADASSSANRPYPDGSLLYSDRNEQKTNGN
ncbi:uncharacterized protein VTP21DRAFT_4517 [Calcarisporiella thermophila]|uniref:uncharacterized protein n=1 Tax=Calcarisporiella thermophila TaxID=911321 RepID=UPI003743FBDB